eukprot:TRINITY_DN8227_c0_g1_i5.p1 TRINITY_DN8227_c0_g1~~TRINITY_DN8227_c0_g1_i5.p1  ORF type:complete len:451 (+),score=37.66 TRINITY_DN8227_c0_g1_i5:594-1946(+)
MDDQVRVCIEGNEEIIHECSQSIKSIGRQSLKIWLSIFFRSLRVTVPVVFILWVYLSPAMVMKENLSTVWNLVIYNYIRVGLTWVFLFGLVCAYGFYIYGAHLIKNAALFVHFPGTIIVTFLLISFNLMMFEAPISLFFILVGIFVVTKEKDTGERSGVIGKQFERKLVLSSPLAKMSCITCLVVFFVDMIFNVFQQASFPVQIVIRFIVLPLFNLSVSGVQVYLAKSVPDQHLPFVVPMIWISHGILLLNERVFTNTMFQNENRIWFVVSCFLYASFEALMHLTYFQRHEYFDTFLKDVRICFSPKLRTRQRIYVNPTANETVETHCRSRIKLNYSNSHRSKLRKLMFINDINSELIVIISATFMLYFIDGSFESNGMKGIKYLNSCIFQISIQLVFEFASDLIGIYWITVKNKIVVLGRDLGLFGDCYWIWMLLILWQYWNLLDYYVP